MENKFDILAKEWDSKPMRVQSAMTFVDRIKENIKVDIKNFNLLDYGCGSGLVSFGFANDVEKIDGYDNSVGMIEVYNEKADKIGFENINGILHDIDKEDLKSNQYDIAVTNMTMHHIKFIDDFVTKLANSLKKDGQLFIADLCIEDGTFHSDNTGVVHFGFEMDDVKQAFEKAGLKDISVCVLQTIEKPVKNYDVFFATGRK
jgi:2-polyprenyl-3-methyl-5-hydroxy-6-metoxy-1,4-benzoquinol methylase